SSCVLSSTSRSDIYSLSLHDALPISYRFHRPESGRYHGICDQSGARPFAASGAFSPSHPGKRIIRLVIQLDSSSRPVDRRCGRRSEEHTSELQSRENLVCRLLLEKKK